MELTLEELKNYLRVDNQEDDSLIQELLLTAKKLVKDVGRLDETALENPDETVRTAVLFCLSYLYENRNTADFHKLTLTLRALLFSQREGVI